MPRRRAEIVYEELPEYLTPTEVAEIRRLKEPSLAQERFRMLHHDGDGPPFVKDGSRVLYPRKELEAWLDARVRRAQAS